MKRHVPPGKMRLPLYRHPRAHEPRKTKDGDMLEECSSDMLKNGAGGLGSGERLTVYSTGKIFLNFIPAQDGPRPVFRPSQVSLRHWRGHIAQLTFKAYQETSQQRMEAEITRYWKLLCSLSEASMQQRRRLSSSRLCTSWNPGLEFSSVLINASAGGKLGGGPR